MDWLKKLLGGIGNFAQQAVRAANPVNQFNQQRQAVQQLPRQAQQVQQQVQKVVPRININNFTQALTRAANPVNQFKVTANSLPKLPPQTNYAIKRATLGAVNPMAAINNLPQGQQKDISNKLNAVPRIRIQGLEQAYQAFHGKPSAPITLGGVSRHLPVISEAQNIERANRGKDGTISANKLPGVALDVAKTGATYAPYFVGEGAVLKAAPAAKVGVRAGIKAVNNFVPGAGVQVVSELARGNRDPVSIAKESAIAGGFNTGGAGLGSAFGKIKSMLKKAPSKEAKIVVNTLKEKGDLLSQGYNNVTVDFQGAKLPVRGGGAIAENAPENPLFKEARKYKSAADYQYTTGDPKIDAQIKQVAEMSPDEYLKQAFEATDGKLGGSYDSWLKSNAQDAMVAKRYAEAMQNGDKFPIAYIDKAMGSQDGRNRALAAKLAGRDKMPVGIIPEMTTAEKIAFAEAQIKKYPEKSYLGNKYRRELTDLYNQATKGKPIYELAPKPTKIKAQPRQINTARLALDEGQTARITANQTENADILTNKEVEQIAKSSGLDKRSYTTEQTRDIIAKQLATRQEAVAIENQAKQIAEQGGNPVELGNLYKRADELWRESTEQGTNVARQLQARRIVADATKTPMQRVFILLDKAGVNPDTYTQKAVGVNFDNPNEVINYYRSLVPAKGEDWLDLVRYNSMLSSPLTQIVNVGNTVANISLAPIERTIASNLDFARSLITGQPRQYVGGEGRAYAKGMATSLGDAVNAFKRTLKGLDDNLNIDVGTQGGHIPIAGKGGSKTVDILSFPTSLLGAFDNFNRTLVAGGSNAALAKRALKLNVRNAEAQGANEAAYRTFNQELGDKSQGAVLRAVDEVTGLVMKARASKNRVVSIPAKFTLPFVRIGTNLLKQGIEYSPAGLSTIPGALNKTDQLAKAVMGTLAFGTAASLLGHDRLTWAEPTDEKGKQAFKAAGMQPYSLKIGDNWIGFSKLPPILSFNLAFVAALDDAVKYSKMKQSGVDNVLTAVARYGNFLSDQSYLKNVGDMLAAVQGDGEAFTKLVGNYPQQLVPGRALAGWFARMTDDTQRKINTDANFAAKQVESLFQQIPGLRQTTTARTDANGQPIASQHPVLNAFSPLAVSTENPEKAQQYAQLRQDRIDKANNKITKENGTGSVSAQSSGSSLLSEYDSLNKDQKKQFNNSPANRYRLELAKYEKEKSEGSISDIDDISRQKTLRKYQAQSGFEKNIVDLYSLSKKEIFNYVKNNPDGNRLLQQAIALDDAMAELGLTRKLRDKYGNVRAPGVKIARAKKGRRGRKGGKVKVAKAQRAKLTKAPKIAKAPRIKSTKTTYKPSKIRYVAKKPSNIKLVA